MIRCALFIGVVAFALPGAAEARGFKFRAPAPKVAARTIEVAPSAPSPLAIGAAAYVGARAGARSSGRRDREKEQAQSASSAPPAGDQPLPAWFKVPPPAPPVAAVAAPSAPTLVDQANGVAVPDIGAKSAARGAKPAGFTALN